MGETANENPGAARDNLAPGIAAKHPEGVYGYGCRQQHITAYAKRKRHAQQNGAVLMEKLQDLKDRICSLENLYAAYFEAIKDKRYREEVLSYTANLDANLFALREEMLNETYAVGSYREFYIRYPKPRLVMALKFRDRVVQWAIYRQLNPYVDKRFIQNSYGCRKGKGTLAAAEYLMYCLQHVSRRPDAQDWYIIKCDISKYFYRVDHETALNIYAEYTDDPWFLRLMSGILNNPDVPFGLPPGMKADDCPRDQRLYEVGMPIGNLTSQETANIYLNKLDQYAKHTLRVHYYMRYMDDFIMVVKGRENAQQLLDACGDFARTTLRLDLSPKCRILPATRGCEFVGYMVTPHGLRLRKKTTNHIKRALRHVAEMYALGVIPLDKALEITRCYHGMTKHCNGHNLRRWIEENIVFQRKEDIMKIPDATAPPTAEGRRFYAIDPQADGTVDVYLNPDIAVYDTDVGVREYDARVRVVRGVVPFDGMEEDIRARFDAWCESAEVIDL